MMMKEYDFHGPTMSVSAMCASGNAGLITAKSWIDSGIASDVILLATDLSGIPENLRGFSDLGVAVLDTPAVRGLPALPGGEPRLRRAARPRWPWCSPNRPRGSYATMLGGAMTMDAYNAVAMAPDLEGALPLLPRGTRPSRASTLRTTSPTSTPTARGPPSATPPRPRSSTSSSPTPTGIFSVKPLIGHCQAAAAAVEILATVYAYQTGFVPAPPPGGAGPSPAGRRTHRLGSPGPMVKSSIGMGGYNTVVVLGEPERLSPGSRHPPGGRPSRPVATPRRNGAKDLRRLLASRYLQPMVYGTAKLRRRRCAVSVRPDRVEVLRMRGRRVRAVPRTSISPARASGSSPGSTTRPTDDVVWSHPLEELFGFEPGIRGFSVLTAEPRAGRRHPVRRSRRPRTTPGYGTR